MAITALSLTGCPSEPEPEPAHVHDYEWTVTAAATCIATGAKSGVCKLDSSHTTTRAIAIDPDAHRWDEWVGTVTCTQAGAGIRVCLLNEEHTEEGAVIPALGHAYLDWTIITPPTCTETGTAIVTCTRDTTHTTIETMLVNPTAHHYQNWIQTAAPTCSYGGEEEAFCTRDNSHRKGIRDIPKDPTAHYWNNSYKVTTPATCMATGIETDTCFINITHTRTRDVAIDPNAHHWNGYTVTTPAACTAAGVATDTCFHNITHTRTRDVAIDPNAHNYGDWTENQPADGIETRICSRDSLHRVTRTVMAPVQGGSFQLGKALGTASNNPDTTPVSNVTVSGFYMSRYEVTQAQWQAVMGRTQQQQQANTTQSTTDWGRGNAYPIYYVNFYDALVFCNKLSIMEGLTPAYVISGSTDPAAWGDVPKFGWNDTWDNVRIVSGSTGYRLPTEAQWEYAAKGGNTGETYTYAGSNTVEDVAWYYNAGGFGYFHAVGTKAPNGLGLYDMSGNVAEWCWDWYGDYTSVDKTDPTGPLLFSNPGRVVRGGSWSHGFAAEYVRSVYREYGVPSNRHRVFSGLDSTDGFPVAGLRLVRPMN